MLSNRIYRGEIVHKSEVYPGEHAAIVEEALFAQAQAILGGNRVERHVGTTSMEPSLLAGLVHDADGERLTPSHAVKKGVRYRYYVSHNLVSGAKSDKRGLRLPAPALEQLVRERIGQMFVDPPLALLEESSEVIPADTRATEASLHDVARRYTLRKPPSGRRAS